MCWLGTPQTPLGIPLRFEDSGDAWAGPQNALSSADQIWTTGCYILVDRAEPSFYIIAIFIFISLTNMSLYCGKPIYNNIQYNDQFNFETSSTCLRTVRRHGVRAHKLFHSSRHGTRNDQARINQTSGGFQWHAFGSLFEHSKSNSLSICTNLHRVYLFCLQVSPAQLLGGLSILQQEDLQLYKDI